MEDLEAFSDTYFSIMGEYVAVLCFALLCFMIYHLFQYFVYFLPRILRRKKDIKGQRILITGAGSGLGRQLAIQFSKYSTCLVLLDINKESLLETEKILDSRSSVFIYECDISDRRKVYEVAEHIKKNVGDVDILVNNAGIISGRYFVDLTDEQIVKTMEVNTLAHLWMCKSFLPAMIAKNKGHIVSITSLAGKVSNPKLTDYCTSKFAVVGFAECLEMELRERNLDGIKVTIVCPSHIDTGLFDGVKVGIGGTMTAQLAAEKIVAGVLEDREIIYLPYFMKYLVIIKEIFPRWLCIWLSKKTNTFHVMANFTGRRQKNI